MSAHLLFAVPIFYVKKSLMVTKGQELVVNFPEWLGYGRQAFLSSPDNFHLVAGLTVLYSGMFWIYSHSNM